MRKSTVLVLLASSVAASVFFACKDDDNTTSPDETIEFKNRSVTPSFVKMGSDFSGVGVYTLVSSEDVIPNSGNMVYGGAPDGQGFIKNPDGSGYIMVTNHENTWAVSRLYLDKKLNITKGEYIVNSDGGGFRLCSASMATPEIHGFGPMFLTAGESNVNAMCHAIDPLAAAMPSNNTRTKPAMGKMSAENYVPLTKNAYPGKTVVIVGEDASNGQVYLYVSNTVGDLDNGKLYVLRRTDLNQIETSMTWNNNYPVEFVEVPNAKNLTGTEIENLNSSLKSIQFARVEDLDYRKGSATNNREIYFTATGVSGSTEKTYMGRVYQLKLDANDPLKGTLKIIANGDVSPSGANVKGTDIINPDNLCVTENYVYIQEDGDSYWPEATHNSLIWQYNIATGTKKVFMDMRHRDADMLGTKYNPASDTKYGLWEHGAMVDISDVVGVPGTFTINVHAHSWVEGDKFLNPSKAISVQPYKAGGQTLILKNVPR
ncbi:MULTISPECIES: alkaline phosphatase PhoX [unclassified Chryseobacterium]|uniref:alkaline phosphatase PhoX n=1 Tax=unclassified Chryseobacterium TaxID=2593645 RepID=UPI003015D322